MSEVLTMGEPMGLLIAENPGPLKDVTQSAFQGLDILFHM